MTARRQRKVKSEPAEAGTSCGETSEKDLDELAREVIALPAGHSLARLARCGELILARFPGSDTDPRLRVRAERVLPRLAKRLKGQRGFGTASVYRCLEVHLL